MSAGAPQMVAVIDIGKTNIKTILFDMGAGREVAFRSKPNAVEKTAPYPHHDVAAIWAFICESLASLSQTSRIDAISVVAHGATAALVRADGNLALPIIDYEFAGPNETAAAYAKIRPPFAETGSPGLPIGLNVGAQLFWQQQNFPQAFAQAAHILQYPQYWALRLCGVAASEITSLGCHTDLWNPAARDYSSLVERMGWRKLFPPLRPASDVLGGLTPEASAATGLAEGLPVYCGIHDSNASLFPHLATQAAPFAVISTGTWVISFAVGGAQVALDPARDTLINVNAYGNPVPSARFMGGREFELLGPFPKEDGTALDRRAVLDGGVMVLPSVVQGSGPFPQRRHAWLKAEGASAVQRRIAASYYLALMTATCLDLIGARGPTLVEGPFARNADFLAMLGVATGRAVITSESNASGTVLGAAMLTGPTAPPLTHACPPPEDAAALMAYAKAWAAATA